MKAKAATNSAPEKAKELILMATPVLGEREQAYASEMVAEASRKAQGSKLPVKFVVSRLEDLNLGERFDAAICMFNAIDYVTGDGGLRRTFVNIRRHLTLGGVFLFDFRHGVPSVRSYSPTNAKWIQAGSMRILRISESRLDPLKQQFHTVYRYLVFEENRLIKEFEDHHLVVRFYFVPEIQHYLKDAGFEMQHVCNFPQLDVAPSEVDWNTAVVCRAATLEE